MQSDISEIVNHKNQKIIYQQQLHLPFNMNKSFYQSQNILNVYYSKTTMKTLLNQRSQVCKQLKMVCKKNLINKENLDNCLSILRMIFIDSISEFDSYSYCCLWNCNAIYCFPACDDIFYPHCKLCNNTVYVIIRSVHVKIICCNHSCTKKILAQFQIPMRKEKKQTSYQTNLSKKMSSSNPQPSSQSSNYSQNLSPQQIINIKKAAERALEK